MFFRQLDPIKFRGKSPESRGYLDEHHKPCVEKIETDRLAEFPVSVLIWAPVPHSNAEEVTRLSERIESVLKKGGENTKISIQRPVMEEKNIEELIDDLKADIKDKDLVFGIVSENALLLGRLIPLRKEMSANLVVFIKKAQKSKNACDADAKLRRNWILTYPLSSDRIIFFLLNYVRVLRFLGKKCDMSEETLGQTYHLCRTEVDIFFNPMYFAFLSFIRHMGCLTREELTVHLHISDSDITKAADFFMGIKYLKRDSDQYCLTHLAESFFDLFEIANLTTTAKEELNRKIVLFKERWTGPINGAHTTRSKLFADKAKLVKIIDGFYLPFAGRFKLTQWFLKFYKKFFGAKKETVKKEKIDEKKNGKDKNGENQDKDKQEKEANKKNESEKPFGDDEQMNFLFNVWSENIQGPVRGLLALRRARGMFIEYLMSKRKIAFEPQYKDRYVRFKDLVFSLQILRPNPQAHLYLSYSFQMRPLKRLIKQYFDIAVITGEFDILLRRYPPYWHIVNLWVAPGDRTLVDGRGLDIVPFTYRLDFNFNVALELKNIETRRKGCFITCPIDPDKEADAIKESEVGKLETKLKDIFPHPGYLNNWDIDEEGNVVVDKEVVPFYGMKRGNYIETNNMINFRTLDLRL